MLVLPAVTLSKPVNVFANFTFNVPLPSDSTPIFPSDNAPVAPPLTVTVSPNFLLLTAPVSPAKFKPLSRVVLIVVILDVLLSCCAFDAISVNVTCFLSPLSFATVNTIFPLLSTLYLPWLPASGFSTKR